MPRKKTFSILVFNCKKGILRQKKEETDKFSEELNRVIRESNLYKGKRAFVLNVTFFSCEFPEEMLKKHLEGCITNIETLKFPPSNTNMLWLEKGFARCSKKTIEEVEKGMGAVVKNHLGIFRKSKYFAILLLRKVN